MAPSAKVPKIPITNPKIARPMPCFTLAVRVLRRMSRMAMIEMITDSGAGMSTSENNPR